MNEIKNSCIDVEASSKAFDFIDNLYDEKYSEPTILTKDLASYIAMKTIAAYDQFVMAKHKGKKND